MHTPPSAYHSLKHKWTIKHHALKQKVWDKHHQALATVLEKLPGKNQLTAGALSAFMLISTPQIPSPFPGPRPLAPPQSQEKQIDKKAVLLLQLAGILPTEMKPLTVEQEKEVGEVLTQFYAMPVSAQLEGRRLNRSYGLIGGEQHLYRYPGDTLAQHATNEDDRKKYLPSGIAPSVGAWRHFANSKSELTQQDIEREKWYIAVPTFLAPGFNEDVYAYKDWFKYRKMLVVNPKTGQAVVADIGDAGPAEWTGKHLGGSPEVMDTIGYAKGSRKGPVLYYFIDDPNSTIPLGPTTTK